MAAAALRDLGRPERARFVAFGQEGWDAPAGCELEAVGRWEPERGGDEELEAGRLAGRAIERAIQAALSGRVDGLVTGPVSKRALRAAGRDFPGHTEWLRERAGVPEVTMLMAAERTPLGGPLRIALLTGHMPLREVPDRLSVDLVVTRTRIALRALRDWWGIESPRACLAGLNPHASEGGLFGDEESRILEPAADRLYAEGWEITDVVPADTAFRRCIESQVDMVAAPYHDVGLAVLKTVARDTGVNVTTGLPFPRTAPDHGTAFDIAGRGVAHPGSMVEAVALCIRFCRAAAARS